MPANRRVPADPSDGAPDPAAVPDFHADVLDAVADGVYVVDTRRRITYWNPAATRVSGYEAENVIGRWCGDGLLNHVDEQGASLCGHNCPLRATMDDGEIRTTRVYMHHATGHLTPIRVTASPLRDKSGTVIGAVETFADETKVRAVEQQLRTAEELALKDPLTGLSNRRAFDRTLEQRVAAWARHRLPFAALAIDVDQFKAINDTHGHETGDAVLRVVGERLGASVRDGDLAVRVGGDEFAVVFAPGTEPAGAAVSAERVARAVAAPIGLDGGLRLTVGVSFGLATAGAGEVMHLADVALYDAKRARGALGERQPGDRDDGNGSAPPAPGAPVPPGAPPTAA